MNLNYFLISAFVTFVGSLLAGGLCSIMLDAKKITQTQAWIGALLFPITLLVFLIIGIKILITNAILLLKAFTKKSSNIRISWFYFHW